MAQGCNSVALIQSTSFLSIKGDITPVQKPGKSWRKINAPDHDWDQSKTYAVTPMTHLFLETKEVMIN